MCASSQPLATAIGVRILQSGGTAADAAVAMAAALGVLEPCSTGLGGDAFALYYHAETRKVHALQGNGASAAALSLEHLHSMGIGAQEEGFARGLDPYSALCITVPGAAALWEDLLERHGRLKLLDALQPAIDLARDGFPIAPMTAKQWAKGFVQGAEAQRVLFKGGRAPRAGEVVTNPDLAETMVGARPSFPLSCTAL
jgi:gamma-glutamyltranspeptidase/glutathione hydrolase